MICPRCGYEQPDAPECLKCGVVIDKYVKANPQEPFQQSAPPSNDDKANVYKPVYTHEKPRRVSAFYRNLLYAFITIMLIYLTMVYFNNRFVRKSISAEISNALKSNLMHEFNKTVIAQKVAEIGDKQGVTISPNWVEIIFLYDGNDGNVINYTIEVTTYYTRTIFGNEIKTDVVARVGNSLEDDGGLKALRLKSIFSGNL